MSQKITKERSGGEVFQLCHSVDRWGAARNSIRIVGVETRFEEMRV